MKSIGKCLLVKKIGAKRDLDDKTVFHLFNDVIRGEYGRVGCLKIRPRYYKNGKVFVDIYNSNWANELWINKGEVIKKINKKIGYDEIKDIGV